MSKLVKMHRLDCPALLAWDVPGACNCDAPTLDLRVSHDERDVCPDCGGDEFCWCKTPCETCGEPTRNGCEECNACRRDGAA